MLKEKWQKLLLRVKVLLVSGILAILSIPLSLITLHCMAVSMTFFVVSVFYNLFKSLQMANVSISEAIETDTQKGMEELKEGKKISGTVRTIALPLATGVGIPMIFILLISIWIAI